MSAVMLEIEVVAKVNRKDIFANRDNGRKSATAYIVLYLRLSSSILVSVNRFQS